MPVSTPETAQTRLLLVPLEDLVVFPNMNVTLTVDVGDEERVLLVPVHEGEYAKVGTVAEVTDRMRLPGGGRAIALNGLHRGIAGAAGSDNQGRLFVDVEERPDEESADGRIRELEREYRAVVEEILELRGDDGRIAAFVRSISEPGALADTTGYSPDINFEQKVRLLETVDVRERLELALELQRERLALMQVRRRIQDDVERLQELQLLLEVQVRRITGGVGKGARARDRPDKGADAAVVAAELEDLLDHRAVLPLQVAREGDRRRRVRTFLHLDPQHAVVPAMGGAGDRAVAGHEHDHLAAADGDPLRHVGHHAHPCIPVATPRDEEHAGIASHLGRDRHRHTRKDRDVVECDQPQVRHEWKIRMIVDAVNHLACQPLCARDILAA